MKKFTQLISMFIILTLTANVFVAQAQDDTDIPHVTIEATADGFVMPDAIPEGAVTVIVQNNSDAPAEADFYQLNEGVTATDFEERMAEGNPMVLLELGVLLPGLPVEPGAAAEVTYNFEAGNYVVLNWPADVPQEIIPFTVADEEGDGAAPPAADVSVDLTNFAFNMPIQVSVGEQVWHFSNMSEQPHEVILVPIGDMTVQALNEILLTTMSGGEGPDDIAPVQFIPPMTSGAELWLDLDLEPGAYVIVCSFPDIFGDFTPHAMLGMRQTFIVTE